MGLEKAGLKLITAWTKTSERSLLATRPVKVNIEGLRLAEPLSADTVNISKVSLLQRVLGNQTVEKEIYDVTKWQKEFFAKTYDGLKTPEEKAAYIGKLRLAFEIIKTKKFNEYDDMLSDIDRINFIRDNFQYLHHAEQAQIVKKLESGKLPDFISDFDNNKMFELVLKDKTYNLDCLEKIMQMKRFKDIDAKVYEISRQIDENIAKMGIKLPTTEPSKIPQQLKECEINEALYHSTPYYHGVRGGDEAYKMKLFKEHGSSRFGPINSTGTNILFTTDNLGYAEHYGGPNVLKMYCRKDYPIVDDAITHGINTDSWTDERLMYDLLYEKGIKFIKNDRETLIIDPKAVTFVSDFKNNYVP